MKRSIIVAALLLASCGAQPAFCGTPLIPPRVVQCVCTKQLCQLPPCYEPRMQARDTSKRLWFSKITFNIKGRK